MQLALSGQGLSEQQLNDFGLNFIRTQLITVPGHRFHIPMAASNARFRLISIPPAAVQRFVRAGCGECDLRQNLILPTGTSKSAAKNMTSMFPTQRRNDCRSEPNSDQDGRQYHHLHERRGLGARWLSSANQYCARQWPAVVLLTIQKAGDASTLKVISGDQGAASANCRHTSSS